MNTWLESLSNQDSFANVVVPSLGVDYIDDCGQMYGGCYPACSGYPTPSFTKPPCSATTTSKTKTKKPCHKTQCLDHVNDCGQTYGRFSRPQDLDKDLKIHLLTNALLLGRGMLQGLPRLHDAIFHRSWVPNNHGRSRHQHGCWDVYCSLREMLLHLPERH